MRNEARRGKRAEPAGREALALLDEEGLVAFVRELIAIPSLDGDEAAAQRRVAGWLKAEGLFTDEWQIDLAEMATHPEYSSEVARRDALGVVGWTREAGSGREAGGGRGACDGAQGTAGIGGGLDLLLNGHIDVVPPGDASSWAVGPWTAEIRDGRIYGRGACDMKGGLAAALFATKAVRDAGVPLEGRVGVASVVGEEEGGVGTLAMLVRGHTAGAAVVTEPTGLAIVTAEAGSLMFRLVVEGRAAHGSVREEGVSAIEEFLPLFEAVRALEAERCRPKVWGQIVAAVGEETRAMFRRHPLPWPIEIGTLRAGEWASSVPQELVCEGRYGFAPDEDEAAARFAFEEAIAAASSSPWLRRHPPRVEWWGGRFAPAVTEPSTPIVNALRGAAQAVLGRAAPLEAVTYGSDMRLLTNVGGIPTVLFGPGDVADAHRTDESIAVEELLTAARVLVVAALRFCCGPD